MTPRLSSQLAAMLLFATSTLHAELVRDAPTPGGFALVANKIAADLVTDPDDYQVVQIAARLLATDIEKVTSLKSAVHSKTEAAQVPPTPTLYIGTLGHSPTIDALIKSHHIDISAIEGKWESYLITPIANPAPGVNSGLLIVGSDRRGTAFGVLQLSDEIGVSPWNWWADVPASTSR